MFETGPVSTADDTNKRETVKGPVEITGKRKQASPLTGKMS